MDNSEIIKRRAFRARKKLYALFYTKNKLAGITELAPFDGIRPDDADQKCLPLIRKRLGELPDLIKYLPRKEQKNWIKALKWTY